MRISAALPTDPRFLLLAIAGVTGALNLAGCAAGPARVALQGDLPSLKASVADAERRGELGEENVRELAEAVLARELSSQPEPVERFPEVSRCAPAARAALEHVATGSGEAAALASVELVDAGFAAPSTGLPEGSDGWLAVEARRLVAPRPSERRRALMLHGSSDVRRAALSAARDAAQASDVPALLEAARLDPDPRARALAVDALGAIGGSAVVVALIDLWSAAEPPLRSHITEAWAAPRTAASGGVEQLVGLAERSVGTVQVEAALALARIDAGPPGAAAAVLARAIRGKAPRERVLAVLGAPWSSTELAEAIVEARRSEDPATRVAASLRLVEHGALDAGAREDLFAIASGDTEVAAVARAVAAHAGDGRVKPALRAELTVPRGARRTLAAAALVALDDWAGAAHALGDDSPEVRQAVACHVLAKPDAHAGADDVMLSRFAIAQADLLALLAPAS